MLDVREQEYPSGAKYYEIYAGDTRIGSYQREGDSFLPWGCRKPLAKEKDAQLKVIQRYVAARLKEAAKAAELYKEFDSEVLCLIYQPE
jgi:hypothetical protein